MGSRPVEQTRSNLQERDVVFVVSHVDRGIVPTYKVNDFDGTPLEGTFYEQELQRVTVSDEENRSGNDKENVCWFGGKGGLTNTIVGFVEATWCQDDYGFLRDTA